MENRSELGFSKLHAWWMLLHGPQCETVNSLMVFMGMAGVTNPGVLPVNIEILLQIAGLLWSILKRPRRALFQYLLME